MKLNIQQRILFMLLGGVLTAVLAMGVLAFWDKYTTSERAIEISQSIGREAADNSEEALLQRAELQLRANARNEAARVDEYFAEFGRVVQLLAQRATDVGENSYKYARINAEPPKAFNGGRLSLQLFTDDKTDIASVREEASVYAYLSNLMTELQRVNDHIISIYISSPHGWSLVVDRYAANGVDDNGQAIPFNAIQRPWYQGAVASQGLYYSDVMMDIIGGELDVTCAMPFYINGSLAGVVGLDTDLENTNHILQATMDIDHGTSFILNKDGKVVFSSSIEKILQPQDMDVDLRQSDNQDLAALATEMASGAENVGEITIDGNSYIVGFAPMHTTGWSLGVLMPREEIVAPAEESRDNILTITDTNLDLLRGDMARQLLLIGVAVLVLIGISIFVSLRLAHRFTEPIYKLANGVNDIANGNLDQKLTIKTGDELEILADNFNSMTHDLQHYMENLKKVTADKERIATELSVARSIQKNLLPCIFPPYPNNTSFDIHAIMEPAKEVGGDFYDFYMLDDDHLVVTIADVSDKGVPAALFMVVAKTILKNYAKMLLEKYDFAECVSLANEQLCENNEEMMFVTAFTGILNLRSGEFNYVNAGHSAPVVKYADGRTEYLDVKTNCVLGVDDFAYESQTVQLSHDSRLLLYTDGLTEAMNEAKDMFGSDKVQQTWQQIDNGSCQSMLDAMHDEVKNFVGDAEQSDDLTMLTLWYK